MPFSHNSRAASPAISALLLILVAVLACTLAAVIVKSRAERLVPRGPCLRIQEALIERISSSTVYVHVKVVNEGLGTARSVVLKMVMGNAIIYEKLLATEFPPGKPPLEISEYADLPLMPGERVALLVYYLDDHGYPHATQPLTLIVR